MSEEEKLRRGLNLPMAIFIIVGMVIGSSIWVNPAAYLSETGPAIFLAYIIAVLPAIFVAYICAYLGSAFPVAGGTYVITSRLVGGFGGFMSVWMVILAVGCTLAYLGTTFGVFIGQAIGITSGVELIWFSVIIGIIVLTVLYFLNWIKIEISGAIELIITLLGDILVMIIFIIAAIPAFNVSNFDPLFPIGFGPVLFAALTFYFSYTGFTLILDVAGEVKNPRKNIPKALLISIIFLVAIYTIQALMVAGVQPWDNPIGTVVELILTGGLLPQGAVLFISILIAVAIASTIHPSYMAFSRDIMVIGREHLFPKKFGEIHDKHKTPVPALTLLYIVGIVFIVTFIPLLAPIYGVEISAVLLSAIVGVVVLILQIPVCIGAVVLPKRYPKWHEGAGFKPSLKWLRVMGILGAVLSFIFVFLVFTDPDAGLIIAIIVFPYAILGAIVYAIRKYSLNKSSIDMKKILSELPEPLEEEEGVPSKIEKLAKEKEEV